MSQVPHDPFANIMANVVKKVRAREELVRDVPGPPEERSYAVYEVAELIGQDAATVLEQIKQDKIHAEYVLGSNGRAILIPYEEVGRLMREAKWKELNGEDENEDE